MAYCLAPSANAAARDAATFCPSSSKVVAAQSRVNPHEFA
jgi:hypothetical protein